MQRKMQLTNMQYFAKISLIQGHFAYILETNHQWDFSLSVSLQDFIWTFNKVKVHTDEIFIKKPIRSQPYFSILWQSVFGKKLKNTGTFFWDTRYIHVTMDSTVWT